MTNNNGEESLRRAEEEEEEGEGRGCRTNESEYGAVEAWTDEVVDRVGVASCKDIFVSHVISKLNGTDR